VGVIQQIGVGWWCHRLAVIGLERFDDVLAVVAEIQDERVLFEQGRDAIEPGQGLYRVESGQHLVHVHGVQQGLVEAGLEL
jgi:hypothetical protein